MATAEEYLRFLPLLHSLPQPHLRLSYDAQGDVLYVQFSGNNQADDSELTDDDIIVRYRGEEIIGYTILHASKR